MHGSIGFSLTPLLAAAGSETAHLDQVKDFLGILYLSLAAMNGFAALYWWQKKGDGGRALFWAIVSGFFVILAPLAMTGYVPGVPAEAKNFVDAATGPVVYSVGTTVLLVVMFIFRRFFV